MPDDSSSIHITREYSNNHKYILMDVPAVFNFGLQVQLHYYYRVSGYISPYRTRIESEISYIEHNFDTFRNGGNDKLS